VLVMPLLLFTLVAFAYPIALILFYSVADREVGAVLPKTITALKGWDGNGPIPDRAFASLIADASTAYEDHSLGRAADRLNYDWPGFRSLLMGVGRHASTLDVGAPRKSLTDLDPAWGQADTWRFIALASGPFTPRYLLAALDLRRQWDGQIVPAPANQRIYVMLFVRTIWIAAVVLFFCVLLGYPVAYWMAHQSEGMQRFLFYCVILPFWTSLLVRTGAWLVLLEKDGIINALLVWLGIIDTPLQLAFNRMSVYIVMTHLLLPFMILPLYSSMKRIPGDLVRAASSLGARPFVAFATVYFPQSVPGLGAGALLVFILALGFYITPQLIGGSSDQMISNMIAYYATGSANWGMAGALAFILVFIIGLLFPLYRRYIGFDQAIAR
jgi:putative spermidine/putrescine transport system permease protein